MTGGILHLSSYNQTGYDIIHINPQITFFKKVYKRHTNFGIETIKQSLTVTPDFNTTNNIFISKTGSLITNMYFDFSLPPAAAPGANNQGVVSNYLNYAHWVNNVGHAIIDEVSLFISNNIIDKHNGLYYDILNELTDPNHKEWPLIGKYDESGLINLEEKHSTKYCVPLKFYFNKNSGLGLPIFLLDENNVRLELKLNSLESLLKFDKTGTTTITSRSISEFNFYTTYIFLEKEEECKIKNNLPVEYLIETIDIVDNLNQNQLNNIVVNNPVKELIWVFRHNNRLLTGSKTNDPLHTNNITLTERNDIFNYSNNNIKTTNFKNYDTFTNLEILIGNNIRVNKQDAYYFRNIQPYTYHSNIPGGINQNEQKKYIYSYSFSLEPESYQPTGTYNFTKLNEKLKMNFTGHDLTNFTFTMFLCKYEYLTINNGKATKNDVPFQSMIDENINNTLKQIHCDNKPVKNIIESEEKKKFAYNNEIKRRLVINNQCIPNNVKANSKSKVKWAGLQGSIN